MIKELKYGGLTASPLDYECSDGDLAISMDMIPEDGSLKPVVPPKPVMVVPSNYKLLYVHEGNGYKNYIVRSSSDIFALPEGYASEEGEDYRIMSLSSSVTLHQINAIGNTLVILSSEGMHYLLYKDSSYVYLGDEIPELAISFGLQGEMIRTDEFSISFDSISEGNIWNEFSDSNKTKITSQVLAKVNKFIADNSTHAGKFIYPFLVRYAYRLYDGTLTKHSAPVLMICSSDLAPQVFFEHITGKNSYTSASLRVVGMCHSLDYAVVSSSELSELKKWSDIVSSVDIFVSAPIYTYDQNGECTKFVKVDDSDCYCVCKHTNQAVSQTTYPLRYQRHKFSKLYAFTFNPSTLSYPTGRLMIPEKSLETVKGDIKDCSQFYFLESIGVENLSTSRTLLTIEEDYLQSLVTREVMSDDFDSHDKLMPQVSFTYNQRLNVANIRKRLFAGFSAAAQFCHSDGYVNNWSDVESTFMDTKVSVSVFVYIKQDGKDIVVRGNAASFGYNSPTLFFYYPNINAYKAIIVKSNYFSDYYEIPLEPHNFLNGAFYFGGWEDVSKSVSVSPVASSVAQRVVELPNKLYTSEVNNPFRFPVLGINTIGTGKIVGMSSAVKALSQGQFGQFPLYAFTTDGVWALEVSGTGTFTARQPVTRDICVNPGSITQIDSAVLFVTDRGIMLLSGSEATCISEIIDGALPDMSAYPSGASLLKLSGIDTNAFAFVSFREFLSGCQMFYDYTHQRIVVFNPSYAYAYVYSLKSKSWGMMSSQMATSANAYPETAVQLHDGSIVDYAGEGDYDELHGFILSRPLKLDGPNILKTVYSIIQRGNFNKGDIKVALFGSRDLANWHYVYSSADHYLRGFAGTPYKYYRIGVISSMKNGKGLFGCSINYESKQGNDLR